MITRHKVAKIFLISTLLCVMSLSLVQGKASAAYTAAAWCGNWAGDLCHGYFDGGDASGYNGGDLIAGGIPSSVNSATEFINYVCGKLNGTARDRMGASMIIDEMMGYSHDRQDCGTTIYNAWAQRVRDYAAAPSTSGYGVDWFRTISAPNRDSAYASDINDDVFHIDMNGGNITVVDFYYPGGAFQINRNCANLVGPTGPLPSWGKMVGSSVAKDSNGNNITGGSIAAGRTINWTHTVNDDGSVGPTRTPTITGSIRKWVIKNGTTLSNVYTPAYSQSFTVGNSISKGDNQTTTNPGDIGKKYCEHITGDHTSSYDNTSFSSASACVLVVTPPTVTPSTSITPSPVGIGQTYTATSTLTNSEGLAGSVTATWRTWLDGGDQIYGTAGDAPNGSVDGPRAVTVPANGSVTFGTRTGTADATHAYVCTEIYNVTGQSGTIITIDHDKTCSPIVARPYFSVLGGDVAAGPGFGADGAPGAGIIGTNNDGSPDYNGSSAQLAALALGKITSFTTSQNPNGGVGPAWTNSLTGSYVPSMLGFANTAPPVGVSTYGGNFNQVNWQVQDYYATTPNGGLFPGFATASGNYSSSGMNLNGGTIAADGRKIVLKVNGDVYIKSNIIYAAASVLSDIPQFELIVSGNIYVDSNVSELDGIYVAQGDGTNTGKFVSCSDSTPQALYGSGNIATCNQQLVVNGAVAAQKVILNRTYGDINGGGIPHPQAPGEVIRFTPLLWMPSAIGGSGTGGWQSVTSLPPIL